ncbi:MAG TPA: DUF2314 domain-containing protein [Gemmatimonadaceae bacterium]|jgi:uncharacterized protein YegJ (DUF2314 family)
MTIRLVVAVPLLIVVACFGTKSDQSAVRQSGHAGSDSIEVVNGDTSHILPADDWEVLSAQRDARTTFVECVRRFREHRSSQSDLSVKVRFAEATRDVGDSSVEHLWLEPLAINDSSVRGIVVNTPTDLRHVKYGDTVTVPSQQVSDWYAVDRDTLVGGFTIRLFRSRLTKAQRDSEDRHRPYVIVGNRTEEFIRLTRGANRSAHISTGPPNER